MVVILDRPDTRENDLYWELLKIAQFFISKIIFGRNKDETADNRLDAYQSCALYFAQQLKLNKNLDKWLNMPEPLKMTKIKYLVLNIKQQRDRPARDFMHYKNKAKRVSDTFEYYNDDAEQTRTADFPQYRFPMPDAAAILVDELKNNNKYEIVDA